MTNEELKQLAIDQIEGRIFSSIDLFERDLPLNLLTAIFMPLGLMNKEQHQEFTADCGLVYEYLDKAGPRSINGMPSFMSVKKLTMKEQEKFIEYGRKYLEMKEAFNNE